MSWLNLPKNNTIRAGRCSEVLLTQRQRPVTLPDGFSYQGQVKAGSGDAHSPCGEKSSGITQEYFGAHVIPNKQVMQHMPIN